MQQLKAQYEQEVAEASQGMDMELMDSQVSSLALPAGCFNPSLVGGVPLSEGQCWEKGIITHTATGEGILQSS